jgi:hypothetical protein
MLSLLAGISLRIPREDPSYSTINIEGGVKTERVLANCNGHGHLLEWLK